MEAIGQIRRGYRQSDVDLDAAHVVINDQVANERRPRRLNLGSRKDLAHLGQRLRHHVGKLLPRDAPADTDVRLLGAFREFRVDLHGCSTPRAQHTMDLTRAHFARISQAQTRSTGMGISNSFRTWTGAFAGTYFSG